ncbi:MBL fold metallo-hydrolase [Tenacibaculum finnmarkense genomovar finnmarkense]|uniref:MBL fold metallo-hydrolase n=3 Tax=Tenacibaculum finnmarkense TaxID=2781243 RepID=A0AAP1WGE8_9FLAO|nr:MBL fold metallo-hydrolase [Tenacibaculum finnmarkense]ALU74465.1 MBL fold metallo-hydrolase [Tenacibaculum dicentrarchi]MBE7634917.1 MBL fold metallo-hydrolase [Tenacibaculum finnmarkense genomovar ulcerans]MBE7645678.1 MBL fold metallo-hydrolase [Tenacibaculum finnmarkense genomovar ulcerans]MBE7647501.1 MBL fold metallo-hydrolase [Tenacibaculum finnmarkense genomovar ulcerans]MBE7652987.1 MBL fold metallo-hydrolase [Tenacibaculum finnmarkense genomovar finnmarkense]
MMKKMQLKITFLGTGTSTGVPMINSTHPVALSNDFRDKRLRSSIVISWDKIKYVIDCGPDFRQQMIREKVSSINGILFTHEHADHIAGLDEIRPYCFQMGEVPIYATQRVLGVLKKRYDYIFTTENRYPSAPAVFSTVISHKNSFILDGVKVTPIEVMHGRLPILGYRFNNIAYLTDIKTISSEEKKKLTNLEVLIVTGLRKEPHATHFNLEESLAFIAEIKPKKAYLTHISELLGLHEEVEKELPENVFLAYDGLKI